MKTFIITPELFASKGKRFANSLLDTVAYYIVLVLLMLIGYVLVTFGNDGFLTWMVGESIGSMLFNIFILLLYYLFMEALTQRTLGKYITGTKVIMEDGSKPEMGHIAIRTLCRLIPFEVFSFLGETGRGWHDSLSKTIVVDVKKYEAELALHNSFEEIGKEQY